jgi:hypothetical protein
MQPLLEPFFKVEYKASSINELDPTVKLGLGVAGVSVVVLGLGFMAGKGSAPADPTGKKQK